MHSAEERANHLGNDVAGHIAQGKAPPTARPMVTAGLMCAPLMPSGDENRT
jgi:hypothetical protein